MALKYRGIEFGDIAISARQEEFRSELNDEIISLCKCLPESAQTDAFLFLLRYFNTSLEQGLNFLNYFYAPAWSIVYWLFQISDEHDGFDALYKKDARRAHCMAMLLHPLDDHLHDGQLSVSHLLLLLRSEAWMRMKKAWDSLCGDDCVDETIVRVLLNEYYSSISHDERAHSLDDYCFLFRKQMSTWMIIPSLVAEMVMGSKQFTVAVQRAFGSFGVAWRLLDDINDIEADIIGGTRSSVYSCCPDEIKSQWDACTGEKATPIAIELFHRVLDHVVNKGILASLRGRICSELQLGAGIAYGCGMKGFGDELRQLMSPFVDQG